MPELDHELKVFQYEAALSAGMNTDLLDPNKNCFALEGNMAMTLQAACQQKDAALAARMRLQANPSGINMSTWAAENGLRDHDARTRENLLQYDENAVRQKQAAGEEFYQRMTKQMDEETAAIQMREGRHPSQRGPLLETWQQKSLREQRELREAGL